MIIMRYAYVSSRCKHLGIILLETSSSIEIIAMRNQKIILMKDWTDHSPYSQCPNPPITLSIELYDD